MEGRGLPTFADGKPIRLDGVGIDVTDRTLAENVRFRLAAIVESSDKVSVLISDVGMPGLDGYEFIRRVRSSGNGCSPIPAIALTAYARTEDKERSLAAGFQRHISKPYSIADLTAAVAALMPTSH